MPVLNFKGKSEVYAHHLDIPFYDLMINAKKSYCIKDQNIQRAKFSLDDNLIIHGDNLYALKSLLPRYAGKIQCIYIDPPYNTGNEGWVFNDNVNSLVIKEWLGQMVDLDDLEKHDKWLCMMWPRLHLLKELLSDDGVIFVSIDDNEVYSLKLIMDEIFGEESFLSSLVRQTKVGGGSNSSHFAKEHDYILVYAKMKSSLRKLLTPYESNYLQRYKEKDTQGSFFWDTFARPGLKSTLLYEITAPDGTQLKNVWLRSKERFQKDLDKGEVRFLKKQNGQWSVQFKQRISQGKLARTLDKKLGTTIDGTKELKDLFKKDQSFDYPKPSSLIKFLIQISTSKDAIVLDSFAGSGTTAQAVLDLNKEDGGYRKFILVECEDYAHRITAERVRKVIKGIPDHKNAKLRQGLGGSFTYCTLGKDISENSLLRGKDLPSYEVLSKYVFYTATGQSIDKVKENQDFYVAKVDEHTAFFVIYKPDKDFLSSDASALHLDRKRLLQDVMKKKKCDRAIVFASACFFDLKDLVSENITFCQLPFAIHKMVEF